MSLLLLDILDIDSVLERSKFYLNKSFKYFSQNMDVSQSDIYFNRLLKIINEKSSINEIEDTPINWFTLNVIKSIQLNKNLVSNDDFVKRIFDHFLFPDENKLSLVSLNNESNGFVYDIPINLCDILKLNFKDWNTINSEESYQHWDEVFSSAIELIQKINPEISTHLNKLIKYILAVKSIGGSHGSMSPKNIMGTVFLPDISDYSLVAECLVHEGLHQYLYRLEYCAPLFEDGEDLKELYYSPWKNEPRPLIMVLHGAFVFTGVVLFYDQLLQNNIEHKSSSVFIERVIKRITQVKIAIDVLKLNNHLTSYGFQILNILNDYLDEISERSYIDFSIGIDDVLDHKLRFSGKNYLHAEI